MAFNLLSRKLSSARRPFGHDVPRGVRAFQENIDVIIAEWNAFVSHTSTHGKPIDTVSSYQEHLNKEKVWNAMFISVYGNLNEGAAKHFPRTLALAKKWQNECLLVFFSSLDPMSRIPPHVGNNHHVIRSQIGVEIACPDQCGICVADRTVRLKNRELLVFDDTFEHSVWNDSTENRTVLIIDSPKKLPFFYTLLNKWSLFRFKRSAQVQETISAFHTTV